ncbi:MAG TPA: PAS domain S-box protein [Chitinophagaceae bacterium]|nr:PAS domain S-box protein [Chitinophagaceae bacterium]
MNTPINQSLQKRLQLCAYVLAGIVALIAIAVLVGWQADNRWLKTAGQYRAAMNPVTALCFLLCALSFFCIARPAPGNIRLPAGRALALLVLLAGLLRMADGIAAIPLHIDELLYPGLLLPEPGGGRMSYITALYLLIAGAALLFLSFPQSKMTRLAQLLSILLFLLGLFSLLGYIYQSKLLYGYLAFAPIALHSGFLFFTLGLVILFYTSGREWMLLLTGRLSGSAMARKLIPAAILAPVLFGLLRLWGPADGIYKNEIGIALPVLIVILLFLLLIAYNAASLNKQELAGLQARALLHSSEGQIRAIFDNAPDAVIVMNSGGLVERWNPQATTLFGWTDAEAIGRPLAMLIVPQELRESHERGLKRYLETGQGHLLEKTIDLWAVRKDNTRLDISLRISPLLVNEQQLFIGFARDITEKKKIEDRLKQFNESLTSQVENKTMELKEMFERVTDGFVALDSQFRFTYVNKRAAEILRRDRSSLAGKEMEQELPGIVGSVMHTALIRAMKMQEHVKVTDYHPRLDLWQESNIYPSENGLSVFIRDISEQKKKEQEVSEARGIADKLIDSLPGVFYFYNEQGRFIRWNKRLEEVTGYSAAEISGMHPVDLFPDDEKEYISSRIATVFEKGENDASASFLSKDGKLTPYYFRAVLLEYQGRPCLLGTGIDITELKNAEEKLKESYQSIRQLTGYLQNIREKERLHISREIHDELGQLLTVMKMDISWLGKKLADANPSIQQKITDLLGVIDKTVTTIRRIAAELRPSLLDNLGLSAAMEWHLEEFKKRSGLEVTFSIPSHEISLPDSHKIALFRILQESLTNVSRHAEATSVYIDLDVSDHLLTMRIQDNGKGFDASEPGRRTLGLLGMRERTADIGGRYQIASEPGKGTIVTVTLTVSQQEA